MSYGLLTQSGGFRDRRDSLHMIRATPAATPAFGKKSAEAP
jgi:hypothetical protein